MPFDLFKNSYGNVLPNTKKNLSLIKEYNKIKPFTDRIQFWEFHQLTFICYVLRDLKNSENNKGTFIPKSNFDISPQNRDEWILYYKWQRDKALEQKKIEFQNIVNNFAAISQKAEYKEYRLNEIEQELKILNPNAITDSRRDAKYAYNCEVKGEIPYREHLKFQSDSGTIQGGVLYHLKHFITNYEFSKVIDSPITFSNLFYNKADSDKSIDLFKKLKVIDKNCNYIYESKGFWGFWLDYCKENGIIKTFNKTQYRAILLNEIKGLTLTTNFTEYPKQTKDGLLSNYKRLDKKTLNTEFAAAYNRK